MKKSWLVFWLICWVLFALPKGVWAQGNYQLVASYRASDGIEIRSFSSRWNTQEKLKEVYQELLRNYHRQEISYLSSVNIYPDNPYGVAGYYHAQYFWDSRGNRSYGKGRIIDIYDGDKKTQVADIARVLAHEYGHHFTYFYLWTKEGILFRSSPPTDAKNWRNSGYAKIRGLDKDSRVTSGGPDHRWNIEEIAAEDYVQLFGSPNAKKSIPFKDEEERLRSGISTFFYSSDMFNLVPQENRDLPLASQVPGLEEYWLRLAGASAQQKNQAPGKPILVLSQVANFPGGYQQLVLRWTPVFDDDPAPLEYTLVTYRDGEILPEPVKTVTEGSLLEARYGRGRPLSGWRNFRVYVKDARGKIVSSDVLRINLERPATAPLPDVVIFQDVPVRHWAYPVLKELWLNNVVRGYPDRTFRPSATISKGEFLAMLMGLAPGLPSGSMEQVNESSHWAWPFLVRAAANGLITEADYGPGLSNFELEAPITREEMAMLSARLVGLFPYSPARQEGPRFLDLQEATYPREIEEAASWGIIKGYGEDNFKPMGQANRAEAATVILRTAKLLRIHPGQ